MMETSVKLAGNETDRLFWITIVSTAVYLQVSESPSQVTGHSFGNCLPPTNIQLLPLVRVLSKVKTDVLIYHVQFAVGNATESRDALECLIKHHS